MKLHPIAYAESAYPEELRPLLEGVRLFDSSCSPEATVLFVDRDSGYFLKSAAAGTLAREAALTGFFFEKGLGAPVEAYLSEERDWLLTRKVPGEDCVAPRHLADPKRLCDTLAECLLMLHGADPAGCPVEDHTARYRADAERNYQQGNHELEFAAYCGYRDIEQAHRDVAARGHLLQTDTLLHGDYCLPNIVLDGWRFSGFVDVGNSGVGDRHVDLYWAIWTLNLNLGTDAYRNRFLDAYGRDRVDEERLRLCAAIEAM